MKYMKCSFAITLSNDIVTSTTVFISAVMVTDLVASALHKLPARLTLYTCPVLLILKSKILGTLFL